MDVTYAHQNEYVLISFSPELESFLCIFTLQLHVNDQKR